MWVKDKRDGEGEGGKGLWPQCQAGTCEGERKPRGLHRKVSDCSTVLRKLPVGQWVVFESQLPVRGIPHLMEYVPGYAQSLAGRGSGEGWPPCKCGCGSRQWQPDCSQLRSARRKPVSITLFPLPGMIFHQISACLVSSLPLGLYPNVTFSVRPTLTTQIKKHPFPGPFYLSYPDLFFFIVVLSIVTYNIITCLLSLLPLKCKLHEGKDLSVLFTAIFPVFRIMWIIHNT